MIDLDDIEDLKLKIIKMMKIDWSGRSHKYTEKLGSYQM